MNGSPRHGDSPEPPRRLARTATATRPAHPPDVARTTRQIPGYLLFLANWANAAGLVPRRLAGTKRFRFRARHGGPSHPPRRPEPPPDVARTTRQIPGYLLFLANWANAAGLVPRRLAGTNAPAPHAPTPAHPPHPPPPHTPPLGGPISAVRPIQGNLPLEDTCVSCDAWKGKLASFGFHRPAK